MHKRLLIVLVALLIAAGGLWAFQTSGSKGSGGSPAPSAAGSAVPVTAALSARRDVPVYLEGLGNVQAFNTVTIRTQVDGQLNKIAFKEGQEVHTGDLLAQIDPRTFQAAVDQAQAKKAQDEAQLANARIDLGRYTSLVEKNYVARQQLDTTRALVAQLEATVKGDDAAIENARINLGYTTIKAPIDGRAGIRLVDMGNIMHASDPTGIVVLSQMRPISVLFTLPESAVTQVNEAMAGKPLQVVVLNRDDTRELDEGALELVDNQIDQSTGTVRLKATLPNMKGLLWPGQFVNARLQVSTLTKALTIPAGAVQRGPQGSFVFVIKADGTVDMRKITVGEISQGLAVIQSGIEEGEQVVTEGQYRLQPGSRVEAKMASDDGHAPAVKPE